MMRSATKSPERSLAYSSTSPVVLITGCSAGGIGFHLARAFCAAGCRVMATARKVESMAELVPLGATLLPLDVCSSDSIKAAVQQVIKRAGRIDILINNAGMSLMGPLAEVDLTAARAVFDANYWGLLAMTQAVTPHMTSRRSGTIINIGSITGWVASPFNGIYASSKAAVESVTHALRLELRPFGINVMLVCPGAIKSNFGTASLTRLDASRYVIYRPYVEAMEKRCMLSQQNPTPTEEFAAAVVAQALRPGGPTRVLVVGNLSTLLNIIRRLPYWLSDWVLASKSGLSRPAPAVSGSGPEDKER